MALLISCTTKFTCPKSGVSKVALVDHGRHASLVLEGEGKAELIRFAYGDWDYYALGEDSLWNGGKALFWPTRSGLGRRQFSGPMTEKNLEHSIGEGFEEVILFEVRSEKLKALRRELETLYSSRAGESVHNASYDLNFVPHPESYTLFNNSNLMTARWLEKLGCKVDGASVLSDWERR